MINTYWMGQAVMHGKSMNAHQRNFKQGESSDFCRQLDRLWDCCVVRDRILAFGLNRSMHIDDSEARSSSISSRHWRVATINDDQEVDTALSFSALYDFALILSRILRTLKYDGSEAAATRASINSCSESLDHWFDTAKTLLPGREQPFELVDINLTVMFIYY